MFIFVAMLFLATVPAFGADLGVQDINVGMTKIDVLDKLKAHKSARCNEKRNYCTENTRIKGPVIITYQFGESTSRLGSIGVSFPNRYYDAMVDGLKDKYGVPTASRKTVWKNKRGAAFDNIETVWETLEGSVTIVPLGESTDLGEITILDSSIIDTEMAAEKVKNKKEPGF